MPDSVRVDYNGKQLEADLVVLAGNGESAPEVRPQQFNGTDYDPAGKPYLTARVVNSANTTNALNIKNGPGDFYKAAGYNNNAAARYLKLYNKASVPVVGTDIPFWTVYLPPSSKFEEVFDPPLYFSKGISIALTTGSADNDTGAVGAGDIQSLNIAMG